MLATADLLGGRPEHALADVARAVATTALHHLEHHQPLEVLRATAEYDSGRQLDGWHRIRASTEPRARIADRSADSATATIVVGTSLTVVPACASQRGSRERDSDG